MMSTPKATKARRTAASGSEPGRESRGRVLVVEDEPDLQDLLRYNLEREGFTVTCVARGEQAVEVARTQKPDLVLLDLMLPGMDGLEVCRTLRASAEGAELPIVILTAKGEEADVVVGLELGADDYITKPFSPRVLVARLRAVLRRRNLAGEADDPAALHVAELTIDPARHEVRVGEAKITLTHTEFGILYVLAKRPGRVFTRAQIVHAVQGDHVAVTDRSVDVHVVSLRRKLGEAGRFLQTVRGVGYRIEDV